ncbi:MAG TPA: hypothetical protein VL068_10655 [Microthrixaceae bacterium]|nr:hypothetical protein [Microthrixaceae bacterium]
MAITLAIVEELIDAADGAARGPHGYQGHNSALKQFYPALVHLHDDGSVAIETARTGPSASIDAMSGSPDEWTDVPPRSRPSGAAASVGAVLFELLMARPPLDASDAFEPGITSALPPEVSALLVRSVSDSPAQWPTLDNWAATLGAQAGGSAAPTPLSRRRRDRRRSLIAAVVLLTLAALTVLVISRVPGWWDDATRDEGSHAVFGAAPLVPSISSSGPRHS